MSQNHQSFTVVRRKKMAYWHGLSWSVRMLTIFGYVVAFALLLATAFYTLPSGDSLGSVEIEAPTWSYDVPFVAMIASIVGMTLGWALLLTGASDFSRPLFVVCVCLLVGQLFGFSRISNNIDTIYLVLMWVLILLVLTIPIGVELASRYLPSWFERSYLPLLEFTAWAVMVAMFLGLLWLSLGTHTSRASTFYNIFFQSLTVFLVFWFLLGLQAGILTITVGRWIVTKLRSWLSGKVLSLLTVSALLAQLLLAWRSVGFNYSALFTPWNWENLFYMPWVVIAPSLVLWALALWLTRRWTANSAATLLTFSLASCVFSVYFHMKIASYRKIANDANLPEAVANAAQRLDPTNPAIPVIVQGLLFVGLVTYGLLRFGVRYAETGGAGMPRTGRALVYPGTVILISTLMLYFVSLRPQELLLKNPGSLHWSQKITAFQWLQIFTNNIFAYGMLGLGGLYVIWVACRRREQLVAPEGGTDPSRSYDASYHLTASERFATNCLGGIALGWITLAVTYNLIGTNPYVLDWVADSQFGCITTILQGSGIFLAFAVVLGAVRYKRGTLGAATIAVAIGLWAGMISWLLLASPVIC